MFPKYELLFLDRANSSSYSFLKTILIMFFMFPHFCTTPFDHMPPQYWTYQSICQAKPMEFIIKLYKSHSILWILKSGFSFKVRQHGQKQLYLQYKACWIIYQMVGAPHNPTCAYNHLYNLHQNSVSLLEAIFTFLFHPYMFAKSSLQSSLRLPSSIPQQLFDSKKSALIFSAHLSHLANTGFV